MLFFLALKGLIFWFKFQKTVFSILWKKTWSPFLRDVRYQKLEGALWCCATFTGRGSVNNQYLCPKPRSGPIEGHKLSFQISSLWEPQKNRFTCLFWQNAVFTSCIWYHVVHPLRNKQTNLAVSIKCTNVLQYLTLHDSRHRSCDDTCSFATNLKKYKFFVSIYSETPRVVTAAVAAFDVPLQGLSRNITMRLQDFGSERHI